MRTITPKKLGLLLLLPFLLLSCENNMEKHYEVPEWLRGSAWEILEEEGNYSIFLEGVERAGFRPLLEGKSIVTVMAPDDAVFGKYLQENGYSSLAQMDTDQVKGLIGYHLLYYSYSKEKLINFRPEGDKVGEEQSDVAAGLYYKFRSRSAIAPTVEYDKTREKNVTVYHLERFVPVFSHRFFESKTIDAKSNYEFFYPNSTWKGNDGFNVSNASVIDYQIIADNGYVYTIDQVLTPLQTIYTELTSREDFSIFTELYDRYTMYEYDGELTLMYKDALGVDSIYLHKHGDNNLPDIALEWPTSNYQQVSQLASIGYSVFAPNNQALNQFQKDFWQQGGYDSLNDLDPLVLEYLLGQCVYKGSIVLPQEISEKRLTNDYGEPVSFDLSNVAERSICVNGSFYGLNKLEIPPLFGSVVGPAFKYRNTRAYLYALHGSGLINSYASTAMNYLMLVPTDAQMEFSSYYLNPSEGKLALQTPSEEGFSNVSEGTMQNITNLHTVSGNVALKTTGTQVLPTQSAFNYLYVKDGKIATNQRFNRILEPSIQYEPFVPFREILQDGAPWKNGRAYFYDSEDGIFTAESGDGLAHMLAVTNDNRFPFNSFAQLMKKAGMISGTNILGLGLFRFIAFIPTNEAVASGLAANAIPGITNGSINGNGALVVSDANLDVAQLRDYIMAHFLRGAENAFSTYPYPGSEMHSDSYIPWNTGTRLTYTDNGSSLSVRIGERAAVQVTAKYDYFPFAYNDGCFHLIDSIL